MCSVLLPSLSSGRVAPICFGTHTPCHPPSSADEESRDKRGDFHACTVVAVRLGYSR